MSPSRPPSPSPALDAVYRTVPERPVAPRAPTGDLLDATPADLRALAAIRARARNRIVGMLIGVAVLVRWGIPLASERLPEASAVSVVLGILAFGILGWAGLSALKRPAPVILRLDPADEVAAGGRLAVAVVLHPERELALDPATLRLVARRGGRENDPTIVYESEQRLAEGQSIEAGRAVRLEAEIRVPQELPDGSPPERLRWRVEVALGEPVLFATRRAIRVRPSGRRRRSKRPS